MLLALALAACTPDKAMDFGATGEIETAPDDDLSRQILHDFDGHSFELGANDSEAVVRLADWPEGKHVVIPFWLGINPLMPYFHRPQVGRIYVMSESVMVRELSKDKYLIRAGSKAFKSDAIFEAHHTHYDGTGKMLPTVVRFVGTEVDDAAARCASHRNHHREDSGAARNLAPDASGGGEAGLRKIHRAANPVASHRGPWVS